MTDQQGWASTDDHAPLAASGTAAGWSTTDQQAPVPPTTSVFQQLGAPSWLQPVGDAFQGFGAGVFSIPRTASRVVHWAIPGIPEIPESMTQPPPGMAGQAGKLAEQTAEFMAPASKIAKAEELGVAAANHLPGLWGTAARTGVRFGAQAIPSAAITLAQTGDPNAAKTAAIVGGTLNALSPVVKLGVTRVLGASTGAGTNAMERALEGSPELTEAMRGGISESEVLNNAREAAQNFKDARGAAYQAKLAQIPQNQILNLKPVRNDMLQALKQHRINFSVNSNGQLILDFSRSTIPDAAAQNQVTSIANDVWGWGNNQRDLTPIGVDTLKRRIADLYSPSSNARAFVQRVGNNTRSLLENNVAGYSDMTKEYAQASKFLDNLNDLSLNSKNDGTAIRKLTTVLNQNYSYRQNLLDALSQHSTTGDLGSQVAGNRLSSWEPRGLRKALWGTGVPLELAGLFTGKVPLTPASVAALLVSNAMASPRIAGETLGAAGRYAPQLKMLPGMVGGKITVNPHPELPQFAQGGKVHYDDGGDVDDDSGSNDPTLRDIQRRRMIQLGQNPGQLDFRRQPITINPEQAKQQAFGPYQPEPTQTIEATTPSIGERLWAPIREGAAGRALGISTETAGSRAEDPSNPLIRFEAATPEPGVARGVAQFAGSMTTPQNLLAIAATGGIGALEGQLGSSLVSRLISTGFSAAALHDAYNQIPQFRQAWNQGDWANVRQTLTQMTLGVGMGALGLQHAAGPEGLGGLAETAWNLPEQFNYAGDPERGSISRKPTRAEQLKALEPEVLPKLRTDITADEVLKAAAAGPGKFGGFAAYMERNPQAGENLMDLSNPQPALPNRPDLVRYDPSQGRGRGPSARVVDAFNNPKVIKGFKYYVKKGAEALPDNWYANDPVFKVYQQEWGPLAEEKFFQQMGYQAATSTGSAVPDNIRTGSYYNWMAEQGIPFPPKPDPGYGSKYQGSHLRTAQDLLTQGGVDPLANPKRASFTENLVGNENQLTADKHFVRLLGMLTEDPRWLKTTARVSRNGQEVDIKPQQLFNEGKLTMEDALKDPMVWEEAPNDNEYKYMEDNFRKLVAKPLKYTVADTQGKAWVGAAEKTGMASPAATWAQLLRQRIQYTADRLNVDPQVILRKFVRGEIPLLEIGGAAAGLGALGSMGQPQKQDAGIGPPE